MSAFSSRKFGKALGGIAVIGASALILSGCASTPSGGASSGAAGDGLSLKIGTILPQTGTLAVLGPPEIAAVDLAVKEINEANKGIQLTASQKDSGDTSTDIATQSVTALLSEGVSAIVGAASSGVSLSVIDQITQAGVVEISAANTSPKFSTYDDGGFYFRTAPSDVLQGQVVGNKIAQDGATNVSILYGNNDYGIGLSQNATEALAAQGITVAKSVTFDEGATDFSSAITDALSTNPDALLVISYDEIVPISEQLASRGFDFSKMYGVDGNYGVVKPGSNVDIAGAQFTVPGVNVTDDFRERLQGVAANELTVFTYAPEAYDATVLLALAALQGGATDGTTIKDNMQSVSEGGEKCETFSACADLIAAGTDIDYEGVSGPITFDENGDPSQAYISIYKYATGNTNTYEDAVFGDLTKK